MGRNRLNNLERAHSLQLSSGIHTREQCSSIVCRMKSDFSELILASKDLPV